MKHIVSAFSTLIILVLNLLMSMMLLTVSAKTAAAKEYKAAVVAEIENSNFNPRVIAGCIEAAADLGYTLEVKRCVYDEKSDVCTAEVLLGYTYEIPLFGISDTKITRGIAR